MPNIRIVIVGAGLGGVAAAISCALGGHKVTVLESAKELGEVGAGIQVTPNCTRILKHWGILDALQGSAIFPESVTVHRYSNGKVLAREDNFHKNILQKYAAPFVDMHRADFHSALIDKARELGVQFVLDARVTSMDFDHTTVTTASNETYQADLIVGADGLWSRCREVFLNKSDDPQPTGDIAYRVMLRLDQIQDPELRQWVQTPALHFWIGPGAHVVAYPVKGGEQYNIVLLVPDNLPPGVTKQPGTTEEVTELLKTWDPFLQRLVAVAPVGGVSKWKLMHREELESWISDKCNFVLIGDSCHPMLPYLAQGANSSVEDGAVLGSLMESVTSVGQLKHALPLYQDLRKKRGQAIARETFRQREDFHMDDGPEQEARDKLFESFLGKDITVAFPSRWTCPKVQPWLYGYDAYAEAENALREHPFE